MIMSGHSHGLFCQQLACLQLRVHSGSFYKVAGEFFSFLVLLTLASASLVAKAARGNLCDADAFPSRLRGRVKLLVNSLVGWG